MTKLAKMVSPAVVPIVAIGLVVFMAWLVWHIVVLAFAFALGAIIAIALLLAIPYAASTIGRWIERAMINKVTLGIMAAAALYAGVVLHGISGALLALMGAIFGVVATRFVPRLHTLAA